MTQQDAEFFHVSVQSPCVPTSRPAPGEKVRNEAAGQTFAPQLPLTHMRYDDWVMLLTTNERAGASHMTA